MEKVSIGSLLLVAVALAGVIPAAGAQPSGAADANAGTARLSAEQAAWRYQQGEALERKHAWRPAFEAFLEAAESGDGLAQRKLGDLYSSGNPAVERNYESALRWYHKAREQGVEIPKPFSYPGMPIVGTRK